MKHAEIIEKVHKANAQAHDIWADTHDSNVPYISRRGARAHYWKLLTNAISGSKINLAGACALEIGCGTGTFTDLFLSHGASKFAGIDLSEKMIIKARQKTKDARVQYYVSSLEAFAEKHRGEFDVIVSSSFLHHLVDLDEGIRLIRELLKPGGVYVAIHEVISNRKVTRLEKIDEALQCLWGYSGYKMWPARKRVFMIIERMPGGRMLHFISRARNKMSRLLNRNGRIQRAETSARHKNQPEKSEAQIDYVDYQLNKPFSLSINAAKFGEVVGYSYLAFSSLFVFSRPLNHEMLIMRREK